MADTARSVSDLQTILANNTSGQISAQDLRDMLVSCLGVYGGIYVFEGVTQQDNIGTTGSKITGFAANSENSNGTTPDHTNDQITVDVTGVYDIFFACSFQGTTNGTYDFRLRIDGTEKNYGCQRKVSSADVGSCSFLAPGVSINAGEVVTVYVNSDTATDDITPTDMQLTVRMVG